MRPTLRRHHAPECATAPCMQAEAACVPRSGSRSRRDRYPAAEVRVVRGT
jgi:hypothetical protein